ncbi:hypothetical protein BGZ65_009797 [Modicella reniformis]|uniref:Uncharacterized protein n=1 Tax=Modicella reniformis TaxID=1440133 RepID=A0A9P6J6G9_9FUNG|nr:hypothetical protein BGZ65_009797 [Modicella reniformis]
MEPRTDHRQARRQLDFGHGKETVTVQVLEDPRILNNIREAMKENGIDTLYPEDSEVQVMVRGLNWGDFSMASEHNSDGGLLQLLHDVSNINQIKQSDRPGRIDLILGSDVFYNPPEKWGLEGHIIEWEDFDFDMSKFLSADEGNEKGGNDVNVNMHHPGEEQRERKAMNPSKEDNDDERWLRRAREEVECAMSDSLAAGNPTSRHKIPLVNYSSESESEEGEDVHEGEDPEKERNHGMEQETGSSGYRIGDGGALSSVYLFWICKRGCGNRVEAWRRMSNLTGHD